MWTRFDEPHRPRRHFHAYEGNGQLKPASNTQISVDNGVVTNYTLHQTTADPTTYGEHLEEHKRLYGYFPHQSIADAGYGSEENYRFAEQNHITPFVKYNYFHKETKSKYKDDPFRSENFHYDPASDRYFCPMGQPMECVGVERRRLPRGLFTGSVVTGLFAVRVVPFVGCATSGRESGRSKLTTICGGTGRGCVSY